MKIPKAQRALTLVVYLFGLVPAGCVALSTIGSERVPTGGDPEGTLFAAGITGVLAALVAPLTGIVWPKLPLWMVLAFVAAVVLAAMDSNAWACREAGTRFIHLYDYWGLAILAIPGLVWLILARQAGRR